MIEKVVFMNLCMICDDMGNVLELDKEGKNYFGTPLLGRYIDEGEILTESIIREVFEKQTLKLEIQN